MNIFHNLDLRRKIFNFKTLIIKKKIQNEVSEFKRKNIIQIKSLIFYEQKKLLEYAEYFIDQGIILSSEQYDEFIRINYFHLYILKNISKLKNYNFISENDIL